jgi:CxxC motif-containing protein (DUF1111 family)
MKLKLLSFIPQKTFYLLLIFFFNSFAVNYFFIPLNFFTHDVIDSNNNVLFKYFPFKIQDDKAVISGIKLNYILNNGQLNTIPMIRKNDYYYHSLFADANSTINFYYTVEYKTLNGLNSFTSDTKWFTKIAQTPFIQSPRYKIKVEFDGRLRGRHENEYRSDIFPQTNYKNTVYTISLWDHGDSLEMAIFPYVNTSSCELHVSINTAYDSICGRSTFALNMGSSTNYLIKRNIGPTSLYPQGSPYGSNIPWYSTTIGIVSNGQLVDFEFLVYEAGSLEALTSVIHRYYVGSGKIGQKYQHPWANAAGYASISSVTEKQFCFTQHCANLYPKREEAFLSGKIIFDTDWNTGFQKTPKPSPDCNGSIISEPKVKSPFFASNVIGPSYMQASCFDCHALSGAGSAFEGSLDSAQAIIFLGILDNGKINPHPIYGDVLHYKNINSLLPDGRFNVSYTYSSGVFSDGTQFTLRSPVIDYYFFKGNVDSNTIFSYRISPLLCGAGLLDAICDDSILSHADPDDRDKDGISGKVNLVTDPVSKKMRPARFGWKASFSSLEQQCAYAANRCIGLRNRYYPYDNTTDSSLELSDTNFSLLMSYVSLTVLPPRHNWKDSSAIRGKKIFESIGCAKCHIPSTKTSQSYKFPELADLEIQPFTDLLLHDMGPALADNWGNLGSEWRTPPLWGIGLISEITGKESYLHDGRARSILEAILWHGGEAEKAKNEVLKLNSIQRNDLVSYCKYPFADKMPQNIFSQKAIYFNENNVSYLNDFDFSFDLYKNTIEIQLKNNQLYDHIITVYSITGKQIFKSKIPYGVNKILWNFSNYVSGIYIVCVYGKNKYYKKQFLILK